MYQSQGKYSPQPMTQSVSDRIAVPLDICHLFVMGLVLSILNVVDRPSSENDVLPERDGEGPKRKIHGAAWVKAGLGM